MHMKMGYKYASNTYAELSCAGASGPRVSKMQQGEVREIENLLRNNLLLVLVSFMIFIDKKTPTKI